MKREAELLREEKRRAGRDLQEAMRRFSTRASDAADITPTIRRHPLLFVAGAAATGMVATIIVRSTGVRTAVGRVARGAALYAPLVFGQLRGGVGGILRGLRT
jgi:hypothetical protein